MFSKINQSKHPDFNDQDRFSRIISNEKCRCDRNGLKFSLVVFNIKNIKQRGTVIDVISKRIRCYDYYGYVKKHWIGVLLPESSLQGATNFANNIITKLAKNGIHIDKYSVYLYPIDQADKSLIDSNDRSGWLFKRNDSRVENTSYHESSFSPKWKRIIDIVGAITVLIMVSPLILVTAVLIKSVSKGPVFFKQVRIGINGNKFTFYKFRTMIVNPDTNDHMNYVKELMNPNNIKPMIKLDNKDKQIIPFGRFLRKSCIDEIPQVFNVLKGDMSLVGPRPCLPYEFNEYAQWHKRRFDVLPGMTGMWQVNGKNKLTFKEMISYDIKYSREMTPLLDLKIMLMTIPTIIGMLKN